MVMKGIVLAGGSGTRLYPVTVGVSKQLLPVYDKPMVYYPLSVLMLAGIREILIISTQEELPRFKALLGDGSELGLKFSFLSQAKPEGIAQAFILGADFIGKGSVSLILGDNIFYGAKFSPLLKKAMARKKGATLFGYHVKDPERFGVVEFDSRGLVRSIEEKPSKPKSSVALTGLYFYDNQVVEYAHQLKPSMRGELEITDLNKLYLEHSKVHVEFLGRGFAWLDTGTHESLLEASNFIHTVETRQGFKVGCIEEIAYSNGWIEKEAIEKRARAMHKSGYGKYLLSLLGN